MSLARDIADLGSVTSRLDTVGASSGALSNRNVVINGGMQCWQRATAATAAANGYNTVDRFKFYKDTGAFTTERSDDHPHSAGYSLKAQCTTADTSLSAGNYAFIDCELEGQTLQHFQYGTSTAKDVTLSFWVKSNKTGIYTTSVYKHAGSGTGYMYRKEYTINVANTWEKKEITITPTAGSTSFITASAGAIPKTNGNGIGLTFNFAIGSTYHGADDTWETGSAYATSNQVNWLDSTSNNFYITEIQMEVGSQSTDFEHRSFGDELARCQRYCLDLTPTSGTTPYLAGSAAAANSTVAVAHVALPVQMRATPSLEFEAAGNYRLYNGGTLTVTAIGINGMSPVGGGINFTVSSGLTTAQAVGVFAANGTDRTLCTSEL